MERAPTVHGRDEKRYRDLVRRTALLLSANLPMRDVFGEICDLLARFVNASTIVISALNDRTLRVAYERGDDAVALGAEAAIAPAERALTPATGAHVPMVFGGQVVGVLSVASSSGAAYSPDDIEALETCALYLGALMHDDAHHRDTEGHAHAFADGLTGVTSRRGFDIAIEKERRRCGRERVPLSIVLLGVDHFKAFDDAYGHAAGDLSLRQVARAASKCIGRPGDLFARYSGEQFAVILPFTNRSGALTVAERMREAVFALAVPHERSTLGRISVSGGVYSAVPDRYSDASSFTSAVEEWLRAAKLQGRNRVCAPQYESAARGAERRGASSHNIPESRTSFVGRGDDVARVRALLQNERLVSLVGPGGTGKTRTATETARNMVDEFADGVWFIDLAPLGDLSGILTAIAAAVRLGSVEPEDPVRFAERLSSRSMLLVLDNCEHLVKASETLVEALLANAPLIKVLLTTREAIGVGGEYVYRLPMLGTDDAVRLFIDRANQGGAALDGDRELVESIVSRLDGMPLAIELAAARLPVMSAADLLRGLDDCLNLLYTTGKGLPTRQQTLRALFDWSYDLLEPAQRDLFRRLAIFPMTWSLDAVQPVAAGGLDQLEALVTKSLIQRLEMDGRARFRFLNVTREYAWSFLEEAGEEQAVLDRLAVYFCDLAISRGAELKGMPMHSWLSLQAPDRENYILALRCMLEPSSDPARSESMLESMRHWFHERALVDFRELLPLFESLLSRGELTDAVMAGVALAAADIYGNRDLRRGRDCAERALHFYREVDDGLGAAHALERLASVQRYLEGGVDVNLETPMRNGVFAAKRNGDKRLAAMLLRLLSDIYARKRDAATERAVLMESYELLRECGDDDRSGGVLGRLAVAAFWSGDYEEARNTCRAAITLLEHAGEPWNLAFQLMNLGLFEIFRNDFIAARVALQKSMELLRRYGHEYAVANTFTFYALLAHRTGQTGHSVRLLGYADSLFDTGPRQQQRLQRVHDDLVADLKKSIGEEEYDRFFTAGRSMSHDRALSEAARV